MGVAVLELAFAHLTQRLQQQSPVPATTGSPGPQSRLLCLHPSPWRLLGAPLAQPAWVQRLPEASPTGWPDMDTQICLQVKGLGDEKKSFELGMFSRV